MTLAYDGTALMLPGEPKPAKDADHERVSILARIGHFVLKLNQMQVARAHLLQVSSEPPEHHQSVLCIARGDRSAAKPACADPTSARLLEIAQSLNGVGRYINERQQRSAPYNRKIRTGEITLLELLHSVFLHHASELMRALGEQGFRYVLLDRRGNVRWLARVRQLLAALRYRITTVDGAMQIEFDQQIGSCARLPVVSFSPSLKTMVDIDRRYTCREDCIAVAGSDGKFHSIGFIIAPDGSLVDHAVVRSLFIFDLLRRGGYHAYTHAELDKLRSRYFYYNRRSRRSENMVLNGMIWLFRDLANRYGLKLDKSPYASLSRITPRITRPELLEHIRIAAIASRMIEPLVATEATSDRAPIPDRYRVSAADQIAVCQDFVHAFQLTRTDAQASEPDVSQRPLLTNRAHAAALLAIAQIVVEQVLIESVHAGAKTGALESLRRGIPGLQETLQHAARTIPSGRLGRQYPECATLLENLRATLSFEPLATWLDSPPEYSAGPEIRKGLENLEALANQIDALTGSKMSEGLTIAAERLANEHVRAPSGIQ